MIAFLMESYLTALHFLMGSYIKGIKPVRCHSHSVSRKTANVHGVNENYSYVIIRLKEIQAFW